MIVSPLNPRDIVEASLKMPPESEVYCIVPGSWSCGILVWLEDWPLNPKPYTLNPKPDTLNPKPYKTSGLELPLNSPRWTLKNLTIFARTYSRGIEKTLNPTIPDLRLSLGMFVSSRTS